MRLKLIAVLLAVSLLIAGCAGPGPGAGNNTTNMTGGENATGGNETAPIGGDNATGETNMTNATTDVEAPTLT